MSLIARLCLHLLGQAQDGVAQWIQGARGLRHHYDLVPHHTREFLLFTVVFDPDTT